MNDLPAAILAIAGITCISVTAGFAVISLREGEKRAVRVSLIGCILLGVLFVFIVVLFAMLLAISLLRASRFQKQRLQIGKKSEPTEYVDAWSRYRLKDEDID